jgi:hypothetical protein
MTLPTFAFEDFVADVTNTIEQHLGELVGGRGAAVAGSEGAGPSHALGMTGIRSSTPDPRPATTPPAYMLDGEKIVWHFPDSHARIIDEVR